MMVLELFSGTRSIGRAFEAHGHDVRSVDYCRDFAADSHADIGCFGVSDALELCGGRPDVIWASPDCTTYSVAALGRHRHKDAATGWLMPVTEYAKVCDAVNQHLIRLIEALRPQLWFIENPRGGLRKMPWMQGLPRYTVTYCQYGYRYMKPTDIWTNCPEPGFRPPCHYGDPCHEPAPRGAKTGMQATLSKKDRARIPDELCEHIVEICEREYAPRTLFDMKEAPARAGKQGAEARP